MTVTFTISLDAEPGSLSRLVDPFAQRGLIPSLIRTQRIGDQLDVVIEQSGLDAALAANLCARMRNMIAVRSAAFVSDPA